MALVLAIDPAFTHHDVLQRLADDLAAHEIVFASSCDEALAIIGRQIPDLVVFPVFCSDADEAGIAERVDALSDAGDPWTLAIPLLASTVAETPATPARWFYWFKPPEDETTGGPRDPGAFADEIRDYLATEPDDASTGPFREFSDAAEGSLAERGARAVSVSARVILARLSGARPGHSLNWHERLSPLTWLRSVEAALPLTAAAVPAVARALRARLSGLTPEHSVNRPSSPTWLRSVGASLRLAAGAVPAAARAIPARLSGIRLEHPLVRPQRRSPPTWRRSAGAALLLVLAVTTAAGLTRPVGWFTAKSERAATAGRQPATPRAGTLVPGKKASATRKAGRLSITSTPEGATVTVDGRKRGVTPLMLSDLSSGRHAVTLESAGGTVQRSVDVTAGETATLETSIYPGWLTVFAPIELEIQAYGRVLQFDERHQTLLPPGRHEIVMVSRDLGYRDSRVVDVRPGEVTKLSIEPPRTTLTVAAAAPAQVWLDGTHIGAAPVVDVPIDLGTHQIVVRHPTAGEERRTISATSAPVRVQIDFGTQN